MTDYLTLGEVLAIHKTRSLATQQCRARLPIILF
jgi:hypothetical protein